MGIRLCDPRITEKSPVNTEEKVFGVTKEIEVFSSVTGPNMPPFINVIGRVRLTIISWLAKAANLFPSLSSIHDRPVQIIRPTREALID